jgi:aspartyl-tRNA(Asn)/glutamyl-tRNA(Gln) amidotransferase subunit B
VLGVLFEEGGSPRQVIEARGLAQISDQDALAEIVAGVLAESPDQVADYLGGKEGLLGWFVGQVMRATRGQANAQLVRELLAGQLDSLRG